MVFGVFVDVPLLTLTFVAMFRFRKRLTSALVKVRVPPLAMYLVLSVPLIIFEEQIDCMPSWCGSVLIPPTLPFLLVVTRSYRCCRSTCCSKEKARRLADRFRIWEVKCSLRPKQDHQQRGEAVQRVYSSSGRSLKMSQSMFKKQGQVSFCRPLSSPLKYGRTHSSPNRLQCL